MGKAVVAVDEFGCLHKCIENHKCKSLNVHFSSNKSEVICEPNNKTRQMAPDAFQRKQGSTYFGSVEASCIKWHNSLPRIVFVFSPDHKGALKLLSTFSFGRNKKNTNFKHCH